MGVPAWKPPVASCSSGHVVGEKKSGLGEEREPILRIQQVEVRPRGRQTGSVSQLQVRENTCSTRKELTTTACVALPVPKTVLGHWGPCPGIDRVAESPEGGALLQIAPSN